VTQILGFAGKKQSGKNTICNYFTLIHLISNVMCEKARLNENGEIEVSDILGQRTDSEWMIFKEPQISVSQVLDMTKSVKTYALADPLKELCINILGLNREKVYGTNEQKNEDSGLLWENMPDVLTGTRTSFLFRESSGGNNGIDDCKPSISDQDFMDGNFDTLSWNGLTIKKSGMMSIREVLQYVGTEIFRKMQPKVWTNTLLRRIKQDSYQMALVSDVRFDNEIEAIKEAGGIVVGLLRNYKSSDNHASEQVNLDLCDILVDNTNMTIIEQGHEIYRLLREYGCDNLPQRI
jgi:hypothetical protein